MKKVKSILWVMVMLVLLTACATTTEVEPSDALVPNITVKNQVTQNPYLPDAESMIHNDVYNSDVTNKPMPMGIYTEVWEASSTETPVCPPAFFYDLKGNAVCPYSIQAQEGATVAGGIAIRDVDGDSLAVLGSFLPAIDEGQRYGIQISYSFVDKDNNLIGPTNHGHVMGIRTYDEQGNVLKKFEKVFDVDVLTPAVEVFGQDIDKNLLSITYDYDGNLWFVTGGFHKNPAYSKPGFVGYLEREYIDQYASGNTSMNAKEYLHYLKLSDGENAENGIASHQEGCVILTNKQCYLFQAKDGVDTKWSVAYESSGGKGPVEGAKITGAGLAWGGGSSPTLTNEMVFFTDNMDIVNVYAVDVKNGNVVAKSPVLDLGEDVIVSVENSICVYADGSARTAVYVCNWYGAGNAELFKPSADSSIQSFSNIYDQNWTEKGAEYLMPGMERIDLVKQDDGSYKFESVWVREDFKDTSMMKYSSAAGYIYGYVQDEKTKEWGFVILSADTGKTVGWYPISDNPIYNNMAVGIMQGNNGNTVYCPTNCEKLVRIHDRFAYLPQNPKKKLDLTKMERRVVTDKEFKELSKSDYSPVGYELSATVDTAEDTTLAFRINGLSGKTKELKLFRMNEQGKLVNQELTLTYEDGTTVKKNTILQEDVIYEVRIEIANGDKFDLDNGETIKASILLAK